MLHQQLVLPQEITSAHATEIDGVQQVRFPGTVGAVYQYGLIVKGIARRLVVPVMQQL